MIARIGRNMRALATSKSGHFAMMTAIMTPVAITLAAFAIDAGALYTEKRKAQALADLAAITAAANIDKAAQAALLAFEDNGVGSAVLGGARPDGTPDFGAGEDRDAIVVVPGRYAGDTGTTAEGRFTANATPHNAVRITYRTHGPRYFAGSIIPEPKISVTSLAATSSEAAFSVGSRLLALEGGLVNALLGGLLGSSVNLSVMDYNALLSADVSLLSFLDALALDLDIEAGGYDEVLDARVSVGRIARAIAHTPGLSGTAKSAATRLAQQAAGPGAPTLKLSRLIDLGKEPVLAASIAQIAAKVGVMELLSASAVAAGNGRQVSLDLGAQVPGLLAATVTLAIGEPPQHGRWFAIGEGGKIVRTAQTRLAIVAEIGGPGGLLGARIRVPLYLELAFAEARIRDIACPVGSADSLRVTVDARPGVANLYLAEVTPAAIVNFANPAPRSPAKLIQVPLLISVTGQAHAEMANIAMKPLVFSRSDISSGKVRKVSTQDYVTSLSASLFSSLSLDVQVIGLGLGLPSGISGTVGNLVGAAAPAIDGVLGQILGLLGLSLGQADVRVHGAVCGRAVLVQ